MIKKEQIIRLSIVICTYNPLSKHFNQVIDCIGKAIENETVDCIIVDNSSVPEIRSRKDIRIPPWARVIREMKSGQIYARIAGARESRSDWIIYVDDDNLLAPNFISAAREYILNFPNAGVFTSSISPVYETEPESWTRKYTQFLAISSHKTDVESGDPFGGTLPIGAGMIVKKEVMDAYEIELETEPAFQNLGRTDESLLSGDDTHIGLIAMKLKRTCVLCKNLHVKHLIPNNRLELEYIRKIVIYTRASHHFLDLAYALRKPHHLIRRKAGSLLTRISNYVDPKFILSKRILKEIGNNEGYRIYKLSTQGSKKR